MKFLLFILILVTIWTQAKAGDPHHGVTTTVETNTTINTTVVEGQAAIAALAACQHDYSIYMQGSVPFGHINGVNAGGFCFASKKVNNTYWNVGGAVEEGGATAYNGAWNFKFK